MSEIKSALFGNCFIWKSDFQRPNRNLAFENVMVQIKHTSNKADLISDITVFNFKCTLKLTNIEYSRDYKQRGSMSTAV